MLTDADDEVARSAWRAAVILVPSGAETQLARLLSAQIGRGDRGVQLSLSRALVALGEDAASVLRKAAEHSDPVVRTHAIATERLLLDPDEGFDSAVFEAGRMVRAAGMPVDVLVDPVEHRAESAQDCDGR